jgi:hypothetical protein
MAMRVMKEDCLFTGRGRGGWASTAMFPHDLQGLGRYLLGRVLKLLLFLFGDGGVGLAACERQSPQHQYGAE